MASVKPRLTVVPGAPDGRDPPKGERDAPAALPATPQSRYVGALYARYQNSLLHYLAGLLPGGRQDAVEILQETYIRLLKQDNLDRLEENARAYIFTIATNLVRDSLRKRFSRREAAHVPFDELEIATDEPSPFRNASWEESVSALKQALLRLKPVTRQIFLLSRFEQLTYPEVSEALNISTRTVERHMSIAFKELQSIFEDVS